MDGETWLYNKLSLTSRADLQGTTSVLEYVNLGSVISVRSFGRMGNAFSVYDFGNLGSCFSVRHFVRVGSTLSVQAKTILGHSHAANKIGDPNLCYGHFSILGAVNFGSSMSVRSYGRFHSALSTFDSTFMGSSMSVR